MEMITKNFPIFETNVIVSFYTLIHLLYCILPLLKKELPFFEL